MIERIITVPDNLVAFRATGEITKENYETVVIPAVTELVKRTGELNFILVVDTELSNFTPGAWMQDAWMGLKNLAKWNRSAIVSESAAIRKFTDIFSAFVPGEFRGFPHSEMQQAIAFVSGKASAGL
ncbi:MAG: STAS/SEC14 domain-containing protein [Chitinophagales bacterium]